LHQKVQGTYTDLDNQDACKVSISSRQCNFKCFNVHTSTGLMRCMPVCITSSSPITANWRVHVRQSGLHLICWMEQSICSNQVSVLYVNHIHVHALVNTHRELHITFTSVCAHTVVVLDNVHMYISTLFTSYWWHYRRWDPPQNLHHWSWWVETVPDQ